MINLLKTHRFVATGVSSKEGNAQRSVVMRDGIRYLFYFFDSPSLCNRAKFAYDQLSPHLFLIPSIHERGELWFTLELKGRNAGELVLEGEVDDRLMDKWAQELGKFLRKLHNCPTPTRFGDPTSENRDRSWLTFNGFVASRLEHYLEEIRKHNFSDERVGLLKAAIEELRHQLACFHPRTPPSWNHRRLSLEHAWVKTDSMEIIGITGFEHAVFLPPEVDIAYLLHIGKLAENANRVRALYRGYGAARTMDVQRRERFYRRLVSLDAIMNASVPEWLSIEELFDALK